MVFIQLFPSSATKKFCQRRSGTRRNVHVIITLTFSLLPPAILHLWFEVTLIFQFRFRDVVSEAVEKQKKNEHLIYMFTFSLPPTPPSSILDSTSMGFVSDVVSEAVQMQKRM